MLRAATRTPARVRPRLERLEDRWVPSTVTNLEDSGTGSLRDAIANTPAGGSIDFKSGLTGSVGLLSTLTLTKDVTITGPGAALLTLDGGGSQLGSQTTGNRVLQVNSGVTATVDDLTITKGLTTDGAGILNSGTLTLDRDVVSNCLATVPQGTSPGFGAWIENLGALTVNACTINSNLAQQGGPAGEVARSHGGGIESTGTLTLVNSTLANNEAQAISGGVSSGGGIQASGTLSVTSCTFANLATSGSAVAFSSGTATLLNSILAGDVTGTITTARSNFVGSFDPSAAGNSGLAEGVNGNIVGTPANPIFPSLGFLQDNGGPTPTLLPTAPMLDIPGSPIINAGSNADSPGATDQRGQPRIRQGLIDMGAVELDAGTAALSISPATLPAATSGAAYSQALTVAGGSGPVSFAVAAGALPTGLDLSPAGVLSGNPTAAGSFVFTVHAVTSPADDTPGDSGVQNYTLTVAASGTTLTISPAALPAGTVGTAYSQTLTATGGAGAVTFAVAPGGQLDGLTLSPAGLLGGNPTAAGSFTFTVQAADAGSQAYTLTVAQASGTTLTISPATLPAGTVGTAYSQTFTAAGTSTGAGFTVASGALPPGLALTPFGVLGGIPTAAGAFTFVVLAADAAGHTGTQGYTLTIAPPAAGITLSPAALPAGRVGAAYSQAITASGGTAPFHFAVTAGALPAGLALSPAGVLTGTPTVAGNSAFTVTATDAAGHTGTQGYTVTVGAPGSNALYAVGADAGGTPQVNVYNADGTLKFSFLAYDAGFTGGVRVATGDVNGDGVDDIITGAGPGGGPHVKVFDGRTGKQIMSFFAYDGSFTGGVFVAAGDVTGDGKADIVTGADAGGGPHVRAFDAANGVAFRSFFAYDASFTGGVRVAVGDINGDGVPDIVTGAGAGGGPHVKAFSGKDGSVLQSFFAYDGSFTGGVYVAAGDVTGDGRAEIITGAGAGGAPQVEVFDGRSLGVLDSILAYDPSFTGGVRVSAADLNGAGRADLLTGAGPGGGPEVRAFDGLGQSDRPDLFALDPSFIGGIFVG
jgi:hypothetical protein